MAWPNSGVARHRPSQTFADQYTLIEQSNTLLKQSPRTMPYQLIESSYGSVLLLLLLLLLLLIYYRAEINVMIEHKY